MQPTEHELQTSFRGLEDEELLHLAEDLEQLTPAAQRVLHSEVATRGLQIPPASAPGGSLDLSGTIVTVRRFRDVSEAIVARGALEAAGIACFLRNENTVRLDWQVSNAIGGIRLDVLQSDREAAEAMLAPAEPEREGHGSTGEPRLPGAEACPFCGSSTISRRHRWGGVAMAAVLLFGIPFPRGSKQWRCETCAANWNDEDRGVTDSRVR